MISAADLRTPEFMRVPLDARPTAMGLWLHTDVFGRRQLVPELIAADLYPGQAATETVVEHLLMLDEAGFLSIYRAEGSDWIALSRPLRADMRGAVSECPPPSSHGLPWTSVAVGGAGERARESERERALERAGEWARAEARERAGEWAAWEGEREKATRRPRRPLLMDAPPIGCPDHPHGRYEDCGPCGTARRRHDRWVAEQRYTERLAEYVTEPDLGDPEFPDDE